VAKHDDLGAAERTVALGEAPTVNISLVQPGRLVLEVEGTDDPGLDRNISIQLQPVPNGSRRYLRSPAATEGNQLEYDSISPGRYEAVVKYQCGGGVQIDLLSTTVAIESGRASSIRVQVPPLYPLEVRRPASSFSPFIWIVGEGVRTRPTAYSRRPAKLRLPAGDYEVIRNVRPGRDPEQVLLRFSLPAVDGIDLPEEEAQR
jgi:hypothetical protein